MSVEKPKKRKTVKITFETINKGKYTVIDPKLIDESNARIKKNMREFLNKKGLL